MQEFTFRKFDLCQKNKMLFTYPFDSLYTDVIYFGMFSEKCLFSF